MTLDVIVLAAGLGKRMRSELPKVLHPLAGRPLLAHVLDAAQRVARIVEQKDATASELAIREVNAGFFCLSARRLAPWLSKIGNHNAQSEYYLTDLVALAVADAVPVVAVKAEDQWEVAG